MKKIIELYHKYREVITYLFIGGCTTVINILIYGILVSTVFNVNIAIEMQIANIIAWIVSVLFAYFTNRKIVFRSTNKNVLKEGINFFGSRVATLILEMFIMFLFVTVLHLNDKVFKILAQFLVISGNYITGKFMVFRKKAKKDDV